ncbi:IDEAL domain-containing protein [Cytobacillus gottheilii]|uniref:IDEAL domain-containing protein n=1 Tax=Cytobacillus gottheilii TaxID=859144 RepID=UPI0009B976D9|nr:IDEAL domain-containing protein [Cytobacillus gottheilii]
MTNLQIGDWIKAQSPDGELILGYIDSVHEQEQFAKVIVVTSDNNEAVGKKIPILQKRLKKIPNAKVTNVEQLRFLIDLALETGDREWFNELSNKLNSMKKLVDDVK